MRKITHREINVGFSPSHASVYREGINLPGRNPGIKNIIQGINHPALAHFIMVE